MKYSDLIAKLNHRQKADLLTGKDFWTTLAIPEIGLPAASLSDGPSGVRKQAAASDHLGLNPSLNATCLPSAATVANSWNPEVAERAGTLLGKEAVSQGVNMLLGPGTNMKRNPLCGRNFIPTSQAKWLRAASAAYKRAASTPA